MALYYNKAIVGALSDAASNNSRVSVIRDDGRCFKGETEALKLCSTGMVFVLYDEKEGYKSIKPERITAVYIHK